jgi:hypothetical protein
LDLFRVRSLVSCLSYRLSSSGDVKRPPAFRAPAAPLLHCLDRFRALLQISSVNIFLNLP